MILAILQARMSSSRLPEKVLRPIVGRPMLEHQIKRINRARLIDKMVLATSTDPSDDPLERFCVKTDTDCFRGDLDNVLDRFYRAAKKYNPEHIVRLTGDCPLTDPEVIDATIQYYLDNDFDYVSNSLQPTFPDGLDVEVFSFAALEQAFEEAELPSEKEHVTPYINRNPGLFKIGNYSNTENLSGLRWTVDEPRDFEFVTQIYEALYEAKPHFLTADILQILKDNPELAAINSDIERNEGLKKSFAEDERHKKDEK